MEYDINLLAGYGLNVNEGLGYTGGSEKLLAAVQRYLKAYEKNKSDLYAFLESGDLEGYKIKVHSLKSNSRMIGASQLAEAFEKLEIAAGNGDRVFIESGSQSVIDEYDRLIEALSPVGLIGEVHPAEEIDAEEAFSVCDRLLEALDDFDDETSMKLAVRLSGFPFRITQKGKLKDAIRYIGDFMYDEAAELIRQIRPSIAEESNAGGNGEGR